MDARLDDALELLAEFNTRLKALEERPPASAWAHSVAFLVDRYATRKNILWTAGTLATAVATWQAAFNGLPLT